MKATELMNKLTLQEKQGWVYVPFAENTKSFYTFMLENDSLTLAWIAVHERITANHLNNHHFLREKNTENGISNSVPRLLIVTDGKQWWISKTGDVAFNYVNFSGVLIALYHELKFIAEYFYVFDESKILQKRLINILDTLKLEVRRNGDFLHEGTLVNENKPFTNKEDPTCETSSITIPNPINPNKDEELKRYSKLLHQQLFQSFNFIQLKYLLRFQNHIVYAHQNYKKGQLLICVTEHEFKNQEEMSRNKNRYLIVDKYTDIKTLHLGTSTNEEEFLQNFFRINMELVNEFLLKEPF
jgi:hypothetical protein